MASEPHIVDWLNHNLDGWSAAMGLRYLSASADEVVAEIIVGPVHLQAYGIVHGGVHAGVVESVTSVGAAIFAMQEGQRVVGLDNHTSFLRTVREGRLVATARPLTRGRRTQVWSAEIVDAVGRLVAQGQVRHLVMEGEVAAGRPEGADVGALLREADAPELVRLLGDLPNERLRGLVAAATSAAIAGEVDRSGRALRFLAALLPRLAIALRGALHGPGSGARQEALREVAALSRESLGVVAVHLLKSDPDPSLRALADELLTRVDPALAPGFHAARAVRQLRDSADANERERLLVQLARVDVEAATVEARRLVDTDPDASVRRAALRWIGRGAEAEALAERRLREDDAPSVREAALSCLAELGRKDRVSLALTDPHTRVRLRAGALLAETPAVQAVFDPYEPGRARAAALRAAINGPDAPLLMSFLSDLLRDPEVAVAAIELAAARPGEGSLAAVEPDSEAAAVALAAAFTARRGAEAETGLLRLLESPWEAARLGAIEGLGVSGGAAAESALVGLSRGRERTLAAAATKALARLRQR